MSYEDRMRALRPSTLQMSDYRTPCSRDSSFGGGGVRGGSGDGRGEGGGGGLVPPPPPLTTTPRRTREPTILLEEIGRGGGGTVHKAIHVPSMRLVAVKMVEVHDDDKRRQILQELKTLHSMKTVRDRRPAKQSCNIKLMKIPVVGGCQDIYNCTHAFRSGLLEICLGSFLQL